MSNHQRIVSFVLCLILVFGFVLCFSEQEWIEYQRQYNKKYTTVEEAQRRRINLEKNIEYIKKHNENYERGVHSYTLGINQFSDMSIEEVGRMFRQWKPIKPIESSSEIPAEFPGDIPAELDWVSKGAVTPVKNQEYLYCMEGSYAFSTTGAIEGQHALKTGKLVSLSEQFILDCTTNDGNQGCVNGNVLNSFNSIIKRGGIPTENSYPPYDHDGDFHDCRNSNSTIGATITGFRQVLPAGDENELQKAVATKGPVSVFIHGGLMDFVQYKFGVYDDPECNNHNPDLYVTVVGYGTVLGKPYWKVKNSFGPEWGMAGYIYMARNQNNLCGIANHSYYTIM